MGLSMVVGEASVAKPAAMNARPIQLAAPALGPAGLVL
jgi:hypothetical protein